MRVKNITQRFEAFVQSLQESFWGDFQGQTRQRLKEVLEKDAEQQMADYLGLKWHERASEQEPRIDSRNGFYERNYITALGVIQLRIPRTRLRSFLPRCIRPLERRSPEVAELIRQAFLRGISTRQVGRVAAVVTGEAVSAQTVSQLTRVLDQAVEAFHHRALGDDWAYLFLDGVWLKVRRATGPQRVLLLAAYGVRRNGTRELLAFTRAKSESQAGWEGLLNDLFRRGLCGKNLQLVITDGCPGLARAIETVYPRARHQRCWVHKMRNILEKVRRRDESQVKAGAQKILPGPPCRWGAARLRAISLPLAVPLSGHGPATGAGSAGTVALLRASVAPVAKTAHHQCDRALLRRSPPAHPAHGRVHQRRKRGSDHIYAIFSRFNEDWKTHTLKLFTQAA
jgi:hypothetical protein